MKALYTLFAIAMLLAVACNQPNTGSGTMPNPPDRDTVANQTIAPVETQTVLLEVYKKDKDGTAITAKFKVCKVGTAPPRGFFKANTYACYNEQTKTIVAAQGGCNGSLLHGKFALYYASGDLMSESYYYYGLLDSIDRQYNKAHEITSEKMWNKGKLVE